MSQSALNICCVAIGWAIGATGIFLGEFLAGAKLWKPPALGGHAEQGSEGADVAAALIQGNGDCDGGAAAEDALAGGHSGHCWFHSAPGQCWSSMP